MLKFIVIFLSIIMFILSIKSMSWGIKIARTFIFFTSFILFVFSIVAFIIGVVFL